LHHPFDLKSRISEALAFDNVLLVPAYSQVLPTAVDTNTRLNRNIWLNNPLVSAGMDTVTEAAMAIAKRHFHWHDGLNQPKHWL
jgi:IMP dehydrogenase